MNRPDGEATSNGTRAKGTSARRASVTNGVVSSGGLSSQKSIDAGDTARRKLAMADRLFDDFQAMPTGAVFAAIGHAHTRLRESGRRIEDADAVETLARAELVALETRAPESAASTTASRDV